MILKSIVGLLLWMTLPVLAAPAGTQKLAIQNDSLVVTWDGSGAFEMATRKRAVAFVRSGRPEGPIAASRKQPVRDAQFGKGESLELTAGNGNRHTLMLFPGLPFVLYRLTLANGGSDTAVTRSVRPLSLALDLGTPAASLRAFGTAGLTPADKHPGSYVYLAVADPDSRRGVVGGWITHDRGNGVLFSGLENGAVRLDAQIDYGRLRIPPGKNVPTETLAIGYFEDARLGLEAWADTVARIYPVKLPPLVSGYCTWYSRPNGGASDEQHLVELAEFAARELKPYGFDFIQIDDKWQLGQRRNGPGKNFTTHDPQGPYPRGMQPVAGRLAALGFTAGLWFMPFAGDHLDPFFLPHPEWFAKRADGQPYETSWGGTCLDMSDPGARSYLRGVAQAIRGWGYRYFKMDGLWTGSATQQIYVNDGYREDNIGDALFRDPEKTNIEIMRDGLKLVREAAGPEVFLSGCNLSQNMRSFSGSVGLVDSMRIGADNGAGWPADAATRPSGNLLTGPIHGSRRYFMHGRIWWNDPDPVYVRESMPLAHARLLASWVAISGQIFLSSDWLPGLPAERLDILKRTVLNHGLRPRPVDLFESPIPRLWLLTDTRTAVRRDVAALYNWDSQEQSIEYPLGKLGLDTQAAYEVFDFWGNQRLPAAVGSLRVTVPAQSCRILALRRAAAHPQLLSSSRHVTQGIVDVIEETWDAKKGLLAGQSRVVGNDPYELRVTLPQKPKGWRILYAAASDADQASGAKVVSTQSEAGLLRVVLLAPTSRTLHWVLKFAPGI